MFPAAAAVLAPRTVARLAAHHPRLSVRVSEGSTPALLRDLRNGRLALAVIGVGAELPDYDLKGLATHRVFAGDLCVAVPVGHRLATATTAISVHELAGEPWIVGDGAAGDPQFAAWPTLADPLVVHRAKAWPARLGLVAAGLGICLVPELAAPSVPKGVTAVYVDDPKWLGRLTLAVSLPKPTDEVLAIVDALTVVGRGIRASGMDRD